MSQKINPPGSTYRIRLEGLLDRSITDWFGGLTILPRDNGVTVLVGQFADQAALRGLLDQLWNLNITIVSVERIETQAAPDLQKETDEGRHP